MCLVSKLGTDKLTAPFESAHQFTLVCSFRLQNCSRLSLQFMLKSQFCSDSNSYLTLFRVGFSLPGHSLPLLYTDLCLLRPWSRAFFFVLLALRKCSHDRDSPSMFDPPPMIEFLELYACAVRIKGRHALKWGTCSNSTAVQ